LSEYVEKDEVNTNKVISMNLFSVIFGTL